MELFQSQTYSNRQRLGFPGFPLPVTTTVDDSLGQRTKIYPSLQDSAETAFVARGRPRARHIPLGKVFHFARPPHQTGRKCAKLSPFLQRCRKCLLATRPTRVTQPRPGLCVTLFGDPLSPRGHTFANKVGAQKFPGAQSPFNSLQYATHRHPYFFPSSALLYRKTASITMALIKIHCGLWDQQSRYLGHTNDQTQLCVVGSWYARIS